MYSTPLTKAKLHDINKIDIDRMKSGIFVQDDLMDRAKL
jgi:hypothetical protein